MGASTQVFVVPAREESGVKPGGNTLASYPTQSVAIVFARTWLELSGGGELVALGGNGGIRDKDTVYPGNDPETAKLSRLCPG
jgi:hypothetical protein